MMTHIFKNTNKISLKFFLSCFTLVIVLFSCSTRKEIIYLQDIDVYNNSDVVISERKIQYNDILSVVISSGAISETAAPYNKSNLGSIAGMGGSNQNQNLQMQGYLVSKNLEIKLPILGNISVLNKTLEELEVSIEKLLMDDEHLTDPTVMVNLLNAKFTTLGEIGSGTYYFNENNLTILQAIGMSGDLNIRGERDDIIIIREVDGIRKIGHLDLTAATLFESPYYFIKPNDVIYVKPNNVRVKSAGFITGPSALIGFATLVVTTILLIAN